MLHLSLLNGCGLPDPAARASLPRSFGAEPPPLAFLVANKLVNLSPSHTST